MKTPPPEAMWNSLPMFLQLCLKPQAGDDLIIYHVRKNKTKEFQSLMLLLGFEFTDLYFRIDGGQTVAGSLEWANLREIYNQINDTNFKPAAEVFYDEQRNMKVVIR